MNCAISCTDMKNTYSERVDRTIKMNIGDTFGLTLLQGRLSTYALKVGGARMGEREMKAGCTAWGIYSCFHLG